MLISANLFKDLILLFIYEWKRHKCMHTHTIHPTNCTNILGFLLQKYPSVFVLHFYSLHEDSAQTLSVVEHVLNSVEQ